MKKFPISCVLLSVKKETTYLNSTLFDYGQKQGVQVYSFHEEKQFKLANISLLFLAISDN